MFENQPYQSFNPMQMMANQMMSQYQKMQPAQELIRVTGIEGAKAYQMPPNSSVPLFDSDNDILYVKSTDGAGFPTIRTFAFSPIQPETAKAAGDFVTREEFEQFSQQIREMVDNGKQSVPKRRSSSESAAS